MSRNHTKRVVKRCFCCQGDLKGKEPWELNNFSFSEKHCWIEHDQMKRLKPHPDVTSLILRYPGAPSVCPALDGHAGFSGYSHHLAPASRNPGAYCLHHTASDLLCRPGAHVAAAGGFQCKCVSVCAERFLSRTHVQCSAVQWFCMCFVAQ